MLAAIHKAVKGLIEVAEEPAPFLADELPLFIELPRVVFPETEVKVPGTGKGEARRGTSCTRTCAPLEFRV